MTVIRIACGGEGTANLNSPSAETKEREGDGQRDNCTEGERTGRWAAQRAFASSFTCSTLRPSSRRRRWARVRSARRRIRPASFCSWARTCTMRDRSGRWPRPTAARSARASEGGWSSEERCKPACTRAETCRLEIREGEHRAAAESAGLSGC